jgi:3-hydroxyacyl-[acyl-carrier-protein] dehydratase
MQEDYLNTNKIRDLLPHRYPFLFVDKIIKIDDKYIETLKNISFNEPFFQGHFPNSPIMPGVLIVEAMAQSGGLYAFIKGENSDKFTQVYFVSIDKAKFMKPVLPGDQLIMKINIGRTSPKMIQMKGQAFVDDVLVAEAKIIGVI